MAKPAPKLDLPRDRFDILHAPLAGLLAAFGAVTLAMLQPFDYVQDPPPPPPAWASPQPADRAGAADTAVVAGRGAEPDVLTEAGNSIGNPQP